VKRRETSVFNIAFLDLLSGALGAVIILYIVVPKTKVDEKTPTDIQSPTGYSKDTIDTKKLVVNHLRAEYNQSEEIKKKITKLEEVNEKLKKQNNFMKEEIKEIQKREENLKSKIAAKEEKVPGSKKGLPVDVGFKFKGKHIVFIIDVSGSMVMEDRIGQVKAGLKMLITSMNKDFHVNVIHYPNKMVRPYKKLWELLRPMTTRNKNQVYNFLHKLTPYGATPTRKVMLDALKSYNKITDIVLLSDGAPTFHNSRKKENIQNVLVDIANNNRRAIQINTIGVGSNFLVNKSNNKYIFLKRLAEQHGGFFFGF
jgi:Mg-chelatase subunit ChlD